MRMVMVGWGGPANWELAAGMKRKTRSFQPNVNFPIMSNTPFLNPTVPHPPKKTKQKRKSRIKCLDWNRTSRGKKVENGRVPPKNKEKRALTSQLQACKFPFPLRNLKGPN